MEKLIRHLWHAAAALSHAHAGHSTLHLPARPQIITAAILLALLLAAGYLVSLRLRPYATCRRCHGTGRLRGAFFYWGRNFCLKCDGTGLVPRLGTALRAPARRTSARGQYR